MLEKYYVIHPTGEIKKETIQRTEMLDRMHEIINCDCLEQVQTIIPGLVIIIDESGKIKDPPQPHNEMASLLYLGYAYGKDNIVGPAILASLQPTGPYNELDWFPITEYHKSILHALGYPIK